MCRTTPWRRWARLFGCGVCSHAFLGECFQCRHVGVFQKQGAPNSETQYTISCYNDSQKVALISGNSHIRQGLDDTPHLRASEHGFFWTSTWSFQCSSFLGICSVLRIGGLVLLWVSLQQEPYHCEVYIKDP